MLRRPLHVCFQCFARIRTAELEIVLILQEVEPTDTAEMEMLLTLQEVAIDETILRNSAFLLVHGWTRRSTWKRRSIAFAQTQFRGDLLQQQAPPLSV